MIDAHDKGLSLIHDVQFDITTIEGYEHHDGAGYGDISNPLRCVALLIEIFSN